MNGVTEERTLEADPNLLIDVIKKQAGSLQKAVTEGTMNSIEAGADATHIKLWEEREGDQRRAFLSIVDDGIGIRTEDEILKHFQTFGTPHKESEGKTWAKFRMGRGQMFAFGINRWRTSQFQMDVDVNRRGLDYTLRKGMEEVSGCHIHIELYENPIGGWQMPSVEAFKEVVQEQIRFVKTPVFFNDEQVSVDPDVLDWDYEDDDAYYQFNSNSTLKIYNLGVIVKSVSISRAGVGGIVVSKRQLDVNFARNDIQSTCEVFKRIQAVVQTNKIKKATKKNVVLGTGERFSLLRDLRDGSETLRTLSGKRMFRTAQGKWMTWNMIVKDVRPWTFAEEGDRAADKAMEMGAALCYSEDMLREMNYTGAKDEFFDWLFREQLRVNPDKNDWNQNVHSYERKEVRVTLECKRKTYLLRNTNDHVSGSGLSCLSDMYREDYLIIPHAKTTKVEKRIVKYLEGLRCWSGRRISIGKSTVASAWTDGSTYIVFDRNWLRGLSLQSPSGAYDLFRVGAHEMAHNSNTAGTHVHGPDFYEKYYEITSGSWYNNPISHSYNFVDAMQRARIDEKIAEEEEKDRASQKKLGLIA